MAIQASNSFYGPSTAPGGVLPVNGTPQRLALDNLIRQELRVGDPNDPQQIAQALLARYQNDPRAAAIAQEARGLPFLQTAPADTRIMQTLTSSEAELQQAIDDVERDVRELTTNNLLKDVTPELQGWATAVRSAIAEGATAARFSLDARQRDKAFAIRRQLGDYARMARLVGALTPTLSPLYRKFAQSLDEVAAVFLVLMGEALSNIGFNGGRFLLQAPYSELQTRRDAAIYALRNLVGATQQAYGPNDWPRGLDAYRNLFRLLEIQGQGDLRALLVENELARAMDELIQRAAHGRAEGLRALGATAKLDLQRFRRLITVSQRAVSPESPPLTAFLQALQLFADAFDTGGGFRLLRIARPPILFYGLYGINRLTDAEQVLVDLVIQRGRLADLLDCFLQCGCTEPYVACQVVLDKILYDVDRAIDLYASGVDAFGDPERRAAAYSFIIDVVTLPKFTASEHPISPCLETYGLLPNALRTVLTSIADRLRPELPESDAEVGALRNFVQQAWDGVGKPNPLQDFMRGPREKIVEFIVELQKAYSRDTIAQAQAPYPPTSLTTTLAMMSQELCIQRDAEARWENLVRTMAPDCLGIDSVFNHMANVLNAAILAIGGTCEPVEVNLPPHFETSLDSIADDVDRLGRGRPTLLTTRRAI
jgi:hypothetical protein